MKQITDRIKPLHGGVSLPKVAGYFLATVLSVLLMSCGGGSGGSSAQTITGQFIDDPVQGLRYTCSSGHTGITNQLGEYTCNVGDMVRFSLGAVNLGNVRVQQGPISPYTLFPGDEDAAINVARLLQTVDGDGDPDNGVITLDDNLVNLLPAQTDFSSASFGEDTQNALNRVLVSVEDARDQLHESIIEYGGGLPDGMNLPPNANAGDDQSVLAPRLVTVDGSASIDVNGDQLTYLWGFVSRPDGSTAVLENMAQVQTSFMADVEGEYLLQLEVNDGTYSDQDQVIITAAVNSNGRPVANAGNDQSVDVGSTVLLNGESSSDPNDDELSFTWVFQSVPDGSSTTLINANSQTPTFIADIEGNYVVNLTVTDGELDSNPDSVSITANTANPGGPPTLAWFVQNGTMEGVLHDYANDIALDASGDLFVVGKAAGDLDGQSNNGRGDLFISKYSSDGDFIWTVLNGSEEDDEIRGLVLDNVRGYLYITGDTFGDLDGYVNSGGRDILLSKYNLDGDHQWTVVNGGIESDIGYDVALDSEGNVYMTGMTENGLNGNSSHAGRDIFISKYNPDGDHQWTQQPGTNNYEYGYEIAVDSDDNVVVVGYTGGDLDGNVSLGFTDVIVTKYTSTGSRLWTEQLGTDSYDNGYSIVLDSDNNIYIGGDTWGNWNGTNNGEIDVFIAKLDSDGDLQWITQMGTVEREWIRGIDLDSASNIYVTGATAGALYGNSNLGEYDYFLSKLDNDGVLQWTIQDGTVATDQAESIVLDPVDNIFVAGHGLRYLNESSGEDIFIARYGNHALGPFGIVVEVSGAIGTFTLTNNGGDDLFIDDNGTYTFSSQLDNGSSYAVEVVEGSDTGQGHICEVSGGSNGDGSGVINYPGVTIYVDCVGV